LIRFNDPQALDPEGWQSRQSYRSTDEATQLVQLLEALCCLVPLVCLSKHSHHTRQAPFIALIVAIRLPALHAFRRCRGTLQMPETPKMRRMPHAVSHQASACAVLGCLSPALEQQSAAPRTGVAAQRAGSTHVVKQCTLAPLGRLQITCKIPLGMSDCHPLALSNDHELAFVSGNRLTMTFPESMKRPTWS